MVPQWLQDYHSLAQYYLDILLLDLLLLCFPTWSCFDQALTPHSVLPVMQIAVIAAASDRGEVSTW